MYGCAHQTETLLIHSGVTEVMLSRPSSVVIEVTCLCIRGVTAEILSTKSALQQQQAVKQQQACPQFRVMLCLCHFKKQCPGRHIQEADSCADQAGRCQAGMGQGVG